MKDFLFFLHSRNSGYVSKANSRSKIPVTIPRFLLRKKTKNTVIRFAVVWSYVASATVFSSLITLLWLIHRDHWYFQESSPRRPLYRLATAGPAVSAPRTSPRRFGVRLSSTQFFLRFHKGKWNGLRSSRAPLKNLLETQTEKMELPSQKMSNCQILNSTTSAVQEIQSLRSQDRCETEETKT